MKKIAIIYQADKEQTLQGNQILKQQLWFYFGRKVSMLE